MIVKAERIRIHGHCCTFNCDREGRGVRLQDILFYICQIPSAALWLMDNETYKQAASSIENPHKLRSENGRETLELLTSLKGWCWRTELPSGHVNHRRTE